jgi:hypothetical protein
LQGAPLVFGVKPEVQLVRHQVPGSGSAMAFDAIADRHFHSDSPVVGERKQRPARGLEGRVFLV